MEESDLDSIRLGTELAKLAKMQSKQFKVDSRKLCKSITRRETELTRILEQKYRAMENDDDGMKDELRSLQEAEEQIRRDVESAMLGKESMDVLLPPVEDENNEEPSLYEIPSMCCTSPASAHSLAIKNSSVRMGGSKQLDYKACINSETAESTISEFSVNDSKVVHRKSRRKSKRSMKKKSRKKYLYRLQDGESSDSVEDFDVCKERRPRKMCPKSKRKIKTSFKSKTLLISDFETMRNIAMTRSADNLSIVNHSQHSKDQSLSQVAALFVQMLVGEEFVLSFSGFLSLIARLAFERHEYTVNSFFTTSSRTKSGAPYARTYEGSISVYFSATLFVTALYDCVALPIFWSLVLLLPILFTFVEIRLPHRVDETLIAFCVLSLRFLWINVHLYNPDVPLLRT